MENVAQWTSSDRRDLFFETAARRGFSEVVAEKDFWVCLILGRLVSLGEKMPGLLFKGGTSLSKAFGLIRRFSEDVDLTLNRGDLGFKGDRDPVTATGKARERQVETLKTECSRFVFDQLKPLLESNLAEILGAPGSTEWSVTVDDVGDPTLLFHYPQSLPADIYSLPSVIRSLVKLEFGARSDSWPSSQRRVMSYAAEEFPDRFDTPSYLVNTLDAERTFWEKAVVLHALCHRGKVRKDISRHFYDVAMVGTTSSGQSAIGHVELLRAVVNHSEVFFPPSKEARYDLACPGTFRLVPDGEVLQQVDRDYAAMKEMIFGEPPQFSELTDELRSLEERINSGL